MVPMTFFYLIKIILNLIYIVYGKHLNIICSLEKSFNHPLFLYHLMVARGMALTAQVNTPVYPIVNFLLLSPVVNSGLQL